MAGSVAEASNKQAPPALVALWIQQRWPLERILFDDCSSYTYWRMCFLQARDMAMHIVNADALSCQALPEQHAAQSSAAAAA